MFPSNAKKKNQTQNPQTSKPAITRKEKLGKTAIFKSHKQQLIQSKPQSRSFLHRFPVPAFLLLAVTILGVVLQMWKMPEVSHLHPTFPAFLKKKKKRRGKEKKKKEIIENQ